MAFANVAGRAGFVLELDKSQLDRGLPQAEQQFNRATASMAQSASRSGVTVGRQFDDLLGSVRTMQGRASELEAQLGRVGAAEESAGAAGAGLAGRFGLVATAAYAGYQATQQLAVAMKVTGYEATTTEGKIRNFTSALLQGDIVGGIKALERGQDTFSDLGIAAKDATAALVPLQQIADTMGGKWRTIYEEARLVSEAYREQTVAANQLLRVSLSLEDAQGNLIVAGGFAGLRPQPSPQAPLANRLRAAGFTPAPDTGTTPGASRLQNLQLSLAAARRADDLADQRRIQSEIVAIYQNRIDQTKLTGQALVRFRLELSRQLDVLNGIQDAIDADAQAKADAAERARADRAREAQRKREAAARARAAAARETARNVQATIEALPGYGPYARTSLGFPSEGVSWQHAAREAAKKKKEEDAFTLGDLRQMQFEFLQSLQGITNQFGGNLNSAQTATNTWRTSKLTEQVVAGMDRLARATAHPGAKYARNTMSEAYGWGGGV